MRSRPAAFSSSCGFTLAEVLAAMLFMAIVIPVAVQGVMIANRAGIVAERKRQAAMLADRFLTEQIISGQWRDKPEQEGDFEDEFQGYHWTLKSESWASDGKMKIVVVTVSFRAQEQEYKAAVSTLAPAEVGAS